MKEGDDGPEIVDAGVDDKRLMVVEAEFAGALTVMHRPGNILSRVVRDAWDGRHLAVLTKNKPTRATGPYIGQRLRQSVPVRLRPSRAATPHSGDLGDAAVQELAVRTQQRIAEARKVARVTMTPEAREVWGHEYATLSEGKPGLLGAILAGPRRRRPASRSSMRCSTEQTKLASSI